MSRIRTVKPELFRHEDLFEAELRFKLPLRLAFIGLFGVCDREGRFRWRPRQLKLDILPYDEIDFSLILDALEQTGFIKSYEVEGKRYGYIPSWHKHQVINIREADSVLPGLEEIKDDELSSGKTMTVAADSSILSLTDFSAENICTINYSSDELIEDDDTQFDITDTRVCSQSVSLDTDAPFRASTTEKCKTQESMATSLNVAEPFNQTVYKVSSRSLIFDCSSLNNFTSECRQPEKITTHMNKQSSTVLNDDSLREIQFKNNILKSDNYSDLNLDDMCMHVHDRCTHVHAYACTWGIGREMEKERELEWEEEHGREGEVRRGREVCAKQTYPPRLSDIVAQARHRSGDPPGGLSASQTHSSQISRELVPKNVGYWKLPLGDPEAKQDSALKNIPSSLADIVAQARRRSGDPPGGLTADKQVRVRSHVNSLRKILVIGNATGRPRGKTG